MKRIFFFIPLILLPACATRKPVVVQMPAMPATMLAPRDVASVRYAENVKSYAVGRYVDPNNPLVMHEAHTIYRVETTARWNLHPNAPANVPGGPAISLIDTAYKASPITPEIAAEVERQKAATLALLAQGQRMSQVINQLQKALPATAQAAKEDAQLQAEMTDAEKRLEILENQFRQNQAETTFNPPPVQEIKGTNDW